VKKALTITLLLSFVAQAGERALGTTTATSGSVNNQSTAVPFSIENGTLLSVECDNPSRIGVGVSTCTAATCPTLAPVPHRVYPTSCSYPLTSPYNGTYRKCLVAAQALDGGPSECNWFQRYGNEGASRARTGDENVTYVATGGGSASAPAGQSFGYILNDALTLYVDGRQGSDANACTSSGASACATPGGAIRKAPLVLKAPLVISVAPYDAGYPGFDVPPWELVDPDDGGVANWHIRVEALPDATGLTSPISGTASAGSATAGPYSNWQSLTTSGLTANELRGYLLEITAGTRAGCVGTIYDNTTTVITLTGAPCSGAPDNTSVFRIRDSVNVTSVIARKAGAFDAGSTAQAGIMVQAGWTPPRRPFNTIHGQITGLGVVLSSTQTAVNVAGAGGVSFNGSRIVNTSTTAGTSAVLFNGGAASFTNSYIKSAANNAVQTGVNGWQNKLTLSSALVESACNSTGAAVQLYGHTGDVTTNSAVRLLANTSQCNGVDVTGVRESQIDLAIIGAGSNNLGIVAMNQGNASASSGMGGAYLTHMYFENVGTAFKIEGPQFVRSNASIPVGSGVGTLFDLTHGARVYRQGTCTEDGWTTYLSLDGITYARCTDVAGVGGDVMALTSGTAFDSYP